MTVVGFDTSSRGRVVAVAATTEGVLLRGRAEVGVQVHAALPPLLAEVVDTHLDAVVAVTGPGSYTGLRAGLAAAAGLAQSRGVPIYGVGALDVLAGAVDPDGGPMWVASDAGRGAVYAAPCGWVGGRLACGRARRMTLAELSEAARGARVASADDIRLDGLLVVDPVGALAACVARAVATRPLDLTSLAATYVH